METGNWYGVVRDEVLESDSTVRDITTKLTTITSCKCRVVLIGGESGIAAMHPQSHGISIQLFIGVTARIAIEASK